MIRERWRSPTGLYIFLETTEPFKDFWKSTRNSKTENNLSKSKATLT